MNYLLRSARQSDLKQLNELAKQFTLLNLPSDKRVIAEKIEKSEKSFAGDFTTDKADYLFVVEDLEDGILAGSSQLLGKKGTVEKPAYSFKVIKKERFSKDLGVGFIHQILRLKVETDGMAEVGGLVVDRSYRRIPEKLGRQISLIRFVYIACCRERFGNRIHAEMAPPLTDEGRSEFWESLGRRFTGMPYAEADALSQQNKRFIQDLFPEEDVYMALLDSRARLVVGRVAEETKAAEHMLMSLGFEHNDEVDPFDGGPHLATNIDDIQLVKNTKAYKVKTSANAQFSDLGFVAYISDGEFFAGQTMCTIEGADLVLPEISMRNLQLSDGQEVYFCPLEN
jgi:arginine N-succinyltransferase